MRVIENRCCGCVAPGYPCSAPDCELLHVAVYYCDVCGCECEEDGLCEACADTLCVSAGDS